MELRTIGGRLIFALETAKTILELVSTARKAGADLRGANLYSANLYGADLRSANLRSANLRSANLRSANLYGADLRSANLYSANLYGADLRSANLYSADLYGADLRGADLYGADLRGADLRGADMRGAILRGANGEQKKVHSLSAYSSSIYPYVVLAVLFADGTRMVKMGCLEYTLPQWKKIGIRKSNEGEFPDDGSERSEDRAAMFNLAKAAVMRMKLPKT